MKTTVHRVLKCIEVQVKLCCTTRWLLFNVNIVSARIKDFKLL